MNSKRNEGTCLHALLSLIVQTRLSPRMANTFCYSHTLCLLFSFLYFLVSATSVHFQISRFDPSTPNILYQGDAEPSAEDVEFNNIKYECRVGWVIYAEKVPLWNSKSGELTDFTTHFSFKIKTQGQRGAHGHGLAFFLAPDGFHFPPNSVGGFLGLFNTTTSHSLRNHIVLVEFDSYPNTEWDPPMAHVGINENSISSAVSTPWNAAVHSDDTAEVWVTYNSTTKNLSVSWKYQNTSHPDENTSLSYQIDLMKVLPEWATIGFSAATGVFAECHILQSWEFRSSLFINSTANQNKEKHTRLVVVLSVSSSALVIGALIAYTIVWRRTKTRISKTEGTVNCSLISDTYDLEKELGPRRFSYGDLVLVTDDFSRERKLGEGGFGAVYIGYLADEDMIIAVKKILGGSEHGKKEFITEVKIISQLRHRNLVQLIGWCHDRGEILLVYEFMSNGSLHSHLFGQKSSLAWAVRHKIFLGLASGLLYLHEEWEQCVVHRDMKASNIMLDSHFNAKLGDFGLACLVDHGQSSRTTGLAGTLGYLAPECVITGITSKESEVFSSGIVALEIATGRQSTDFVEEGSRKVLLEWVWDLYGRGEILLAVDKTLNMDEFEYQQAERLMVVGLWCAHPDRSMRPSIRQTIQALNFEVPIPNLPQQVPPLFPRPS